MTKIEDDHYFYTLWLDEPKGDYYIEVVCGRVAIFEVALKLTENEVEKYHSEPTSVRTLAQDVVDSPDSFLDRRVNIPR